MRKWVVCLVVGLAMLTLSTGAGVNDSRIMCGSDVMYPGDVCEETRRGATVDTKTYEEMKTSKENGQRTFNSWGRWALLGGGLALAVLGGYGIVRVRRERASGGQAAQAMAGPGFPPAQPARPQAGFTQAQPGHQPGFPPAQSGQAQPQPGYSPQPGHPPARQPGHPPVPAHAPHSGPRFPAQGRPPFPPPQHNQPYPPQYRQPGPPPNGRSPRTPGHQPPHDFGPGTP